MDDLFYIYFMSAEYFHKEMKEYMADYLQLPKMGPSANYEGHRYDILFFFVEFVCNKRMCTSFEEITAGCMGSGFRTYFTRHAGPLLTEKECKKVLKGFFDFVEEKYGIRSEKVRRVLLE